MKKDADEQLKSVLKEAKALAVRCYSIKPLGVTGKLPNTKPRRSLDCISPPPAPLSTMPIARTARAGDLPSQRASRCRG
jgi:hypothetical protein